jgi:hypothetical protein
MYLRQAIAFSGTFVADICSAEKGGRSATTFANLLLIESWLPLPKQANISA